LANIVLYLGSAILLPMIWRKRLSFQFTQNTNSKYTINYLIMMSSHIIPLVQMQKKNSE
jgi:hypothetical protein